MAEAAVLSAPPRVEFPGGRDGGAVRAPAGDVSHALRLERLDQPGLVAGEPRAVAELAVVTLSPGKYPNCGNTYVNYYLGIKVVECSYAYVVQSMYVQGSPSGQIAGLG